MKNDDEIEFIESKMRLKGKRINSDTKVELIIKEKIEIVENLDTFLLINLKNGENVVNYTKFNACNVHEYLMLQKAFTVLLDDFNRHVNNIINEVYSKAGYEKTLTAFKKNIQTKLNF